MRDKDLYEQVAEQLNLSVKAVEEMDKFFWRNLKKMTNNPESDVIEIPFLGSLSITRAKLNSTMRFSLRNLRRMKKRVINKDDKYYDKKMKDFEIQKELFRNLWKLKNELYG